MKLTNNIIAVTTFFVLSLVIIVPLLPAGQIFTMDMVLPNSIPMSSFSSNFFYFNVFLVLLNQFIPTYWLQKFILFLIILLSSWLMYLFTSGEIFWARIFAGLFYAINPFVYERIMAGHWPFLLAYAIFPLVVRKIIDFFNHPDFKSAFLLALLTTGVANFSPHFLLIEALFFSIYFAILMVLAKGKLQNLRMVAIFLGFSLLFNLNWLVPYFLGKSSLAVTMNNLTIRDLYVFRSIADKQWGLIFNLLSGYGFWAEVHNYFVSPKTIIFFWPVISLAIMAVSFYGLYHSLKGHRYFPLTLTMIIFFLLSLDLAGGVALKNFAGTVVYLYQQFPILLGFREPQKLIAIVMFTYAYFGGIGLSSLGDKVKNGYKYVIVLGIFVILPFVYTPTMFASFWGQLKPAFYPSSWSEVNKILKEDKDNYKTLFFPWHQYMRFNFANNLIIANPAPLFFELPIISSRNPESIPNFTPEQRPEALHVEGLLSIEKKGVNLFGEPVEKSISWGAALAPINVKYIILAKEDDWKTYRFLDESEDLEKVYESEEIILYKNLSWQQIDNS